MEQNLINFVVFQVGWFACVLGAARSKPWVGPLATVPLLAVHFWGIEAPAIEARFLLTVLAIGWLADSVEERLGLLDYGPAGRLASWLSPLWIASLWLLFGSTFHRCLGWLQGEVVLGVLFGGVGGALSYLAGVRLGAVRMTEPKLPRLVGLGCVWAVLVPFLHWLASLEMFRQPSA